MADSKEKLFSDFPAVSTEQWMEKITADLKGADFEKKLVWRTNEGFKVKPFYSPGSPSVVFNPSRSSWR
jgi:methylmalonyl-CoA mutase